MNAKVRTANQRAKLFRLQVVAVEGSRMAELAVDLVSANGFSASITVVQSALEDVAVLPGGERCTIFPLPAV